MLEVLKEFFRLKAEEIGFFIKFKVPNTVVDILRIMWSVSWRAIVITGAVVGLGWCINCIPPIREVNCAVVINPSSWFEYFFLVGGSWFTLLLIVFGAVSVTVVPLKRWIHSNWIQAKYNVNDW